MKHNATYKLSGALLCLSGGFYILDTIMDAIAPQLGLGIGALVPVLGLVGFPGFWASLDTNRPIDQAAYAFGMFGLAGLVPVTFLANRVFPELPEAAVAATLAATKQEFLLISLVFLLSAFLLVITCWTSGPLKRFGAAIYVCGAIPVSLTPFMPPAIVSAGGIAIGIGLLVWGAALVTQVDRPSFGSGAA